MITDLSDLPPEDQALCRVAADVWDCAPVQTGDDGDRFPLVMDLLGTRAGWIPGSSFGVQSPGLDYWQVVRQLRPVTGEPVPFLTAVERALAYHEGRRPER
jgi:hypothetical protein